MSQRYMQDCKMAIVRSGLLKTLPKSSLRVLIVYMTIAKWKNGMFEAGHKGTATLADLNVRDVRHGVEHLIKIGIIERLHVGISAADRSIYKFNLERIDEYGFRKSDGIQEQSSLKFRDFSGDVEIPCGRIPEKDNKYYRD